MIRVRVSRAGWVLTIPWSERMSAEKPPSPPPLEMPPDMDPVYANLVRIAHTASEVIFDFGRILPGEKTARVTARVMMSPLSAKLLHRALSDNLAKFEAVYGEISVPGRQNLEAYSRLFRPHEPPEEPPES